MENFENIKNNNIEKEKEQEKLEIRDLNNVELEKDDAELVRKLREKFGRMKDNLIEVGGLSDDQINSIEKGYELEKVFLEAVSKGFFGEDIEEIFKTNDYDDFINHIDGLLKLKNKDIFGFALDLTYTDSENFYGLTSKLKYNKENIENGHLYNIKYGPDGEIKNVVRPIISMDKNDIKILSNFENNQNSSELSIYMYEEILEQVSKFTYFAEQKDEDGVEGADEIMEIYDNFIETIYELKKKEEEKYFEFLMEKNKKENGNKIYFHNGIQVDANKKKAKDDLKNMKELHQRKMIHLKMALVKVFGSSNQEEKEEYQNYLKYRKENGMIDRD